MALANIHNIDREQKTWTENKGFKSMNNSNKNVVKKRNNNKFNRNNKMYKTAESYDCKKRGTNHKTRSCSAFINECRVCSKLSHYEKVQKKKCIRHLQDI